MVGEEEEEEEEDEEETKLFDALAFFFSLDETVKLRPRHLKERKEKRHHHHLRRARSFALRHN